MIYQNIFSRIFLMFFITGCIEENSLKNGTKITELVKNPEYVCFQSPYENEKIFIEKIYVETGKKIKKFKYQENGTVLWIYDNKNSLFKGFKLENLYVNRQRDNRCQKVDKSSLEKLTLNIDEANHTFFLVDK